MNTSERADAPAPSPARPTRPLRVRLANDFEIVVAGLKAMLEPFADRIDVVETEVHGDGHKQAELTLYDTFGQAQADGLDIDRLLEDSSGGKVVIYSWNADEHLVSEALRKGCRGYLEKSLSTAELVERLERIGAGEIVVPETREKRSATEPEWISTWPGQREGLSMRESEIVVLIAQGYTNAEIAARAYLSPNSLKSYIRSAYRKMGVERRSQAVRWGIEHGMIPTPHDRPERAGAGRGAGPGTGPAF